MGRRETGALDQDEAIVRRERSLELESAPIIGVHRFAAAGAPQFHTAWLMIVGGNRYLW